MAAVCQLVINILKARIYNPIVQENKRSSQNLIRLDHEINQERKIIEIEKLVSLFCEIEFIAKIQFHLLIYLFIIIRHT